MDIDGFIPMEKPPLEWIDKIFVLMSEYFGDKWIDRVTGRLDIHKLMWQTGLTGLNRDEIKSGLFVSRNLARNNQLPPNVIEFYHYAKGIRKPPKPVPKNEYPINMSLAENSIKEIKQILRMSA